jgi:hypothetical protein
MLNRLKQEWAQAVITFLGHTITAPGRSVAHQNVEALQNWPELTKGFKLRQLLGMFGCCRGYSPHYAHISVPLITMTDKMDPGDDLNLVQKPCIT